MAATRGNRNKSFYQAFADSTLGLRSTLGLTRHKIAARPVMFFLWSTLLRSHPLQLATTDLFPEETDLLLKLFEQRRPKTYLEIGVYWGATFKAVMDHRNSLSLPAKCIGLDIWDEVKDSSANTHCSGAPNREIVRRALVKRGYRNFELLSGLSSQVGNLIDHKIDFVFHDANHTYAAVREDFDQLYPLLSDGATVVVHNASKDLEPDKKYYEADGGPYQAVVDLAKTGRWTLEELKCRVAVMKRIP
jgi:predicted O-methyltransferase YrrM